MEKNSFPTLEPILLNKDRTKMDGIQLWYLFQTNRHPIKSRRFHRKPQVYLFLPSLSQLVIITSASLRSSFLQISIFSISNRIAIGKPRKKRFFFQENNPDLCQRNGDCFSISAK